MVNENPLDGLVQSLRASGWHELAATALESAGPLSVLGAQGLYFATPLLTPWVTADSLAALAQVLEDPDATHALARRLTQESAA